MLYVYTISLIPSVHVPNVNVVEIGRSTVIGVAFIIIVVPEFVCTLVYQVSRIIPVPVVSGRENFTPVDVCSSAQKGSVPLAINGVNDTMDCIDIPVDWNEDPVPSQIFGISWGDVVL